MRVNKISRMLLITVVVVFCMSSFQIFGAAVSTRLISMSFYNDTWYEWNGSTGKIAFDPHNVVTGAMHTHQLVNTGFGSSDSFNLLNTTFEFVSDMKRDVSGDMLNPAPYNAAAYFDGSDAVTVKVIGQIYDASYNFLYSGQILEAKLVPVYEDPTAPTEKRWLLGPEENLFEGRFNRSLALQVVPGSIGLASGINIGTDTVTIVDPGMNMFLWTHEAVDFSSQSFDHKNFPSVDIQGQEIPEPVTILLLTIGSLAIRRRR